jgi:hypothetical protein
MRDLVEQMTREQLEDELVKRRKKQDSAWDKLQSLSKTQLIVEIIRLRGKHRAHRKSLIDQQKAILEKNSRIKALEAQLSATPRVTFSGQPDGIIWTAVDSQDSGSVSTSKVS